MGITNSNKEFSSAFVECGGTLTVRLSLTAEPDITETPTDIVLILDRSESMAGSPIANLKNGANKFIDIIDEATDGTQDGQIGSGSRIGIVSFADTAVQNTQLITSVADLKTAIDALEADGESNQEDGFTQALALFDPDSTNAKVMVIFTDGVADTAGDPNEIATLAKAQGVTIYAIGLEGARGIDEDTLGDWASDPDSAYVAIAPSNAELEELFDGLAENISRAGATNIVVTDTVDPCFRITSISAPSKGSATTVDSNTVRWQIDELGVTQSEGATFEFTVEHIGGCLGEVTVNESITYTDTEGNVVDFPAPTVEVICGEVICPEGCAQTAEITVEGCSDTIEFDAGELTLESLGRIVQLDVTLLSVCPNKRVALAVFLNEVDEEGNETKRGMKIMTIPAHTRESCRDVTVRCVKFVLPEDEDTTEPVGSVCGARNFRARFIAHYIDHDFDCCCDTEI